MKKVIVTGPVFSRSGYGEMARFALRSLKSRKDIDLYVLPTNWGNTGNLHKLDNERMWVNSLIAKTQAILAQTNGQPNFDIAVQVTIPNEWKKMAPINIGYTAGIETNIISPAWLQPSQLMDKIIVISEHAKAGFITTLFGNPQGQTFKIDRPVHVVHLPYRNLVKKDLQLNLKHDFNFLAVCQWGPRKNLEQTIIGFLEEFRNEEVGLLLKINSSNDSIVDRGNTENRLKQLLSSYSDRKCSVNLLHGHLDDEEMLSLYTNPKIKAIVSTTHGEGYGLPLMEAAANSLPVIATNWSGHLDFLTVKDEDGKDKHMFGKVDYELKQIANEHVWKGVLEAGTLWAYPKMQSYKDKLRDCFKDYGRYKSQAKKLSSHVLSKMNEQALFNSFAELVTPKPAEKKIQELTNISFCIPTNGSRVETTKKLIKSIEKQAWAGRKYEIILCGNTEVFAGLSNIKLVDKKQEAFSRKVALLRNEAAKASLYENIVFCDDDIVLSDNWLESMTEHSKTNAWNVISNKILSPDGTRYWDRAILNPHVMVDYDHPEQDSNLYQTSCFFMVKREVFDQVKWDETKLVYADREGGIPEDVQYSLDLVKNCYNISFNKNALVWHCDDSYTEFTANNISVCLKKEIITKQTGNSFFLDKNEQYEKTVGAYNV